MAKVTLTRKGWIGLCPVYLEEELTEGSAVIPRRPWLTTWLGWNIHAMWWLVETFNPYEDEFEFSTILRVTGHMKNPIEIELSDFEEMEW